MKTNILILFLFCISIRAVAQQTYVDPTTTFALKMYSDQLAKSQNKTIQEQSKIKKAQMYVATQMQMVHSVQKKVYKGLREVSGTLQNAMQVKNIYADINTCHRYASKIKNLVRKKPQYAVFGAKASEKSYEQLLKIGTEVSSLLKSSDTNLATAGDRYKILFKIQDEVQKLKIWLISATLTLERAIQIGFWKSINPFQGYVNTDKDIVQNMIMKWRQF